MRLPRSVPTSSASSRPRGPPRRRPGPRLGRGAVAPALGGRSHGVVDLCRVRRVHRALRPQRRAPVPAADAGGGGTAAVVGGHPRRRRRRDATGVAGHAGHRAGGGPSARCAPTRSGLAPARAACSWSSPSPHARPSPAPRRRGGRRPGGLGHRRVRRAGRGTPGRPGGGGRLPEPPRTRWRRTTFGDVALRHLARNVLGVLAAGTVATAVGIGHPYWAMVSAVVPLAATAPGRSWCAGCTGSSERWSGWAWWWCSSPSTPADWRSS